MTSPDHNHLMETLRAIWGQMCPGHKAGWTASTPKPANEKIVLLLSYIPMRIGECLMSLPSTQYYKDIRINIRPLITITTLFKSKALSPTCYHLHLGADGGRPIAGGFFFKTLKSQLLAWWTGIDWKVPSLDDHSSYTLWIYTYKIVWNYFSNWKQAFYKRISIYLQENINWAIKTVMTPRISSHPFVCFLFVLNSTDLPKALLLTWFDLNPSMGK